MGRACGLDEDAVPTGRGLFLLPHPPVSSRALGRRQERQSRSAKRPSGPLYGSQRLAFAKSGRTAGPGADITVVVRVRRLPHVQEEIAQRNAVADRHDLVEVLFGQ